MIVGAITLWALPISGGPDWFVRAVRDWRTPPAVLAVTLVAIFIAASQRARLFDTVLPRAWHFATGRYSIDTAYTLQTGWPDKPWGAIYPGARGAYAVVGPRTPIWSMHDTSYCMLPDCRIEGSDSFKIGAGWDRLMFGTPQQGREVLQAAGLNYFLFSRELPMHDYLPRSPLLRPDNIADHLASVGPTAPPESLSKRLDMIKGGSDRIRTWLAGTVDRGHDPSHIARGG
jgi:hypothetical protein